MYTRLKRELEWFWHPHLQNAFSNSAICAALCTEEQSLYKRRMEGEQRTIIWHVRHQDELLRVSAQLAALVNG